MRYPAGLLHHRWTLTGLTVPVREGLMHDPRLRLRAVRLGLAKMAHSEAFYVYRADERQSKAERKQRPAAQCRTATKYVDGEQKLSYHGNVAGRPLSIASHVLGTRIQLLAISPTYKD